jgi:hypothetical protein
MSSEKKWNGIKECLRKCGEGKLLHPITVPINGGDYKKQLQKRGKTSRKIIQIPLKETKAMEEENRGRQLSE